MNDVDNYLKTVTLAQRTELTRIKSIIESTVPDAIQETSYGLPGFKYKGKHLLWFAVFKDHLSLFPTAEPIEVLKDKLKGFATSKGTIKFNVVCWRG